MTPEVANYLRAKTLDFSRAVLWYAEISSDKGDYEPDVYADQISGIGYETNKFTVQLAQFVRDNLGSFSPTVQTLSETIFAIKRRGEMVDKSLASDFLKGMSILDNADPGSTTSVETFINSLSAIDAII